MSTQRVLCLLLTVMYTLSAQGMQCKVDHDCGLGSSCVKAKRQPLGLCVKKDDSRLRSNQCTTDYECEFEHACIKASGQRNGFCVKKAELQPHLPSVTEKPNKSLPPKNTVKECFANYQCDSASKCIKQAGQPNGICVKANDYDAKPLNQAAPDDNKNKSAAKPGTPSTQPKQCTVDLDCAIGLSCDKTYKMCMKRPVK